MIDHVFKRCFSSMSLERISATFFFLCVFLSPSLALHVLLLHDCLHKEDYFLFPDTSERERVTCALISHVLLWSADHVVHLLAFRDRHP